jgi:hypothetical protein
LVCALVLRNEAIPLFKDSLEGYHPSAGVRDLNMNASSKATMKDIEDGKVLKEHVYSSLCSIPCPHGSLLLGYEQTVHG